MAVDKESRTAKWFGDSFDQLHPLIQQLHTDGGTLEGDITLNYGAGIAGAIGKRLGKKMNLPAAGSHHLSVEIFHDHEGLHWNRCFNRQNTVCSLFKPIGVIKGGHWIETTGLLTMKLTVDLRDGGWYWRCLSVSLAGLPVPHWLVPEAIAYKRIENELYQFHVEFRLPIAGQLVSYSGLLSATTL